MPLPGAYGFGMKRQHLLIAGVTLASVSVGLNGWFLYQRRNPPFPPVPVKQEATPGAPPSAVEAGARAVERAKDQARLPPWEIDFSDTAFADGSWKLSEPESAVKLDKPFNWEDVSAETKSAVPPATPVDDKEKTVRAPAPLPPK